MRDFTADQEDVTLYGQCPSSVMPPPQHTHICPSSNTWMQGSRDEAQDRGKHPLDECEDRAQGESCGTGLKDHQAKLEQDGSRVQ